MKVIILAGGYGTRLGEYTVEIPKPMVPIGNKPIMWHIMQLYAHYGHKDFYVALGYKAVVVKEYFMNYSLLNSDFTVNLATGKTKPFNSDMVDWSVTLVDTGQDTMTGGRVKRLKEFIGDETFMLTYGDGLSNIDIEKLIAFHKAHGKMVTVSAVRPTARFGEMDIIDDRVVSFEEKPQIHEGWINGGFFVMEPEFIDLIEGDDTYLEREPLEKVAEMDQLRAFKHDGFWQCMDTKRDKDRLEHIYSSGNAPWTL